MYNRLNHSLLFRGLLEGTFTFTCQQTSRKRGPSWTHLGSETRYNSLDKFAHNDSILKRCFKKVLWVRYVLFRRTEYSQRYQPSHRLLFGIHSAECWTLSKHAFQNRTSLFPHQCMQLTSAILQEKTCYRTTDWWSPLSANRELTSAAYLKPVWDRCTVVENHAVHQLQS